MLLIGRISTLAPPVLRGPWWKGVLDTGENAYLRSDAVDFLTAIRERNGPDPELLFLVEERWSVRGQNIWFGTDAMFDDAVNKGILPRELLAWRLHARARRVVDTTQRLDLRIRAARQHDLVMVMVVGLGPAHVPLSRCGTMALGPP